MRVWYRSRVIIREMRLWGAPPKASSSPATKVPQEVVEMIVAHFIYDKRSLLACSLTCYSWYIAAVPHLHHTLIALTTKDHLRPRFIWPIPLLRRHNLGLLPLVKKLRIWSRRRRPNQISPAQFNRRTLRQFSTLTNIQDLEIDRLDIPGFMPRLRRYFGHLLPTVRSLTLKRPKGCHRQILYFIGLFQHLENLKLLFPPNEDFVEPANLPTLIPLFTPPLRGQLTMTFVRGAMILRDMISLFGGIRFRHMDLFNVDGMRLLLDACAETLETLRLYPPNPGRRLPPKSV